MVKREKTADSIRERTVHKQKEHALPAAAADEKRAL